MTHKQASEELREKIAELTSDERNHILYRGDAGSHNAECEGLTPPAIDEIMSLIHSYANEARKQELKDVRPGKDSDVLHLQKVIDERIAELEKAS